MELINNNNIETFNGHENHSHRKTQSLINTYNKN